MEPPAPAVAPKEKRRPQKVIWLLTYGPSGTYITGDMLNALGLKIAECHSTADDTLNYTYIHLEKRIRETGLNKVLKKLRAEHQITTTQVLGFTALADEDRAGIDGHAVVRMLKHHYTSANPAFKAWTKGEPILKKGPLLKAFGLQSDRSIPSDTSSKASILRAVKDMHAQLQAADAKHTELLEVHKQVLDERTALIMETGQLKRKVAGLEVENASLKRKLGE